MLLINSFNLKFYAYTLFLAYFYIRPAAISKPTFYIVCVSLRSRTFGRLTIFFWIDLQKDRLVSLIALCLPTATFISIDFFQIFCNFQQMAIKAQFYFFSLLQSSQSSAYYNSYHDSPLFLSAQSHSSIKLLIQKISQITPEAKSIVLVKQQQEFTLFLTAVAIAKTNQYLYEQSWKWKYLIKGIKTKQECAFNQLKYLEVQQKLSYIDIFMYSNYRPYPPQQIFPQQNTNNRVQPQQQIYQPNLALNQHPIQSPKEGNRLGRNMYSSTIQTATSPTNAIKSGGFGFGKLESMGRFIQEVPDATQKVEQGTKVTNNQPVNSFNYGNDNHERVKMFTSVIFNKSNEDELNRFPSFNLNNVSQNNGGVSKLQALMNRNKISQLPKEQIIPQTPQEKRKKQILSIKQQLQFLNKKMEKTGLRKVEGVNQGEKKPYFQLPSRKSVLPTPSANNLLNNANTNNSEEFAKQKDIIPQIAQVANNNENPLYQNNQYQNYQKNSQSQNYQPQNNLNHFQPNHQSQPQNDPSRNHQQVPTTDSKFEDNSALRMPVKSDARTSQSISYSSDSGTFLGNANNIQAPRVQEGGMFKKKNKPAYLNEQLSKPADYQQKPMFLPAKNINTVASNAITQFNTTEVVDPPKFKQAIRRAVSLDYEDVKPKVTSMAPKQFTKSDFAIGKKLGKGQYGEVMLVQHKETGFLMGLKVMSKKQIREERYENQIARQLSINFYLAHRNIAPLYGYFSDEQNVYLLVEYCTNGQLLSLLRKNRRMEDPEVSPIIKQICQGLDYIHKQGIIHRDIKPENILFNFNTVKICDFGWAVYSANGMRRTVSGSPLYYSPEVVMETAYDEKIDIWAIGMMTYECLLGKIPFRIYSQLDLNRIVEDEIKFPEYIDVTDDAKDFILKIMKKKPEERMEIKQMLRHPFITKYLKAGKISGQIMEEFRRVIS